MSENLPFDDVTNDDCVTFDALVTQHKRAVHEANGVHKAVIKRAKTSGVDVKAGLYVQKVCKQDREEASNHLLWILRFGLLKGILTRQQIANLADLDVSVSDSVMRTSKNGEAEDKGWEEARGGIPLEDNPFPPDSEQASSWSQGWTKGHAGKQLELSFGGGRTADARKALPKMRSVRKTTPVVSAQSSDNGSVIPVKRGRGRPRKIRPEEIPVQVEAQHQYAD